MSREGALIAFYRYHKKMQTPTPLMVEAGSEEVYVKDRTDAFGSSSSWPIMLRWIIKTLKDNS